MTEQLNANGMSIAPGVVDTIIHIAVADVDGVAAVGQNSSPNLRQRISGKQTHPGIETVVTPEGDLAITLHISVKHGYVLPDLAAKVRQAVSDALLVQVGLQTAEVDIYVDGISFEQ